MSASATDYFKKLGSASSLVNSPKVTTPRAAAGTSLTVDNCNWDTTTGKVFATYQVDTSNNVVAGTEIIWTGVVTGTTSIGSLTRIAGAADGGNSIGDIVELLPASKWANDLMTGILVQHNQDGTHGAITSTSQTSTGQIQGSNLKLTTGNILDTNGNEEIKTVATASAVNEVTVTNAATGTAPQISATGDDTNIGLKFAGKGAGAGDFGSLFVNGVTAFTNSGSAGGTGYYINLGGIKLCWGLSSVIATSTATSSKAVNLPGGFFTSIQSYTVNPATVGSTASQYVAGNGITTSSLSFYPLTLSGTGTLVVSWLVIGT